jgi:diaminohydroxyphosphoribosylaminopyrimidine deaminase/5-amino-6-(5-phosphoribosylamino)uracil reductase
MITDDDRRFMRLALEEGQKGYPSPNPHVGAVIVQDGAVVAVGHHPKAGEGHAEANAIRAAGEAARGATLYVTLEPCNHHGRTPPCSEAVLAAGLARVVVGCADPHPHVPGSSEKLRRAGIEVEVGVLEDEARFLVADFEKHIRTEQPYVIAKAALTLDGKMATRTGSSKWITGPEARAEAHRLRDRSDAVMVGVGTVLADDPALTVRHVPGRSPLRVVLDRALRTPLDAAVLRTDEAPTLVYHGPLPPGLLAKRDALLAVGAALVEVPVVENRLSLPEVLRELGRRDVVRLLVEGGPTLHGALFAGGLVDRVALFFAPKILGDAAAPGLCDGLGVTAMSDALRVVAPRVTRLGDDLLLLGDLAEPPGKEPRGCSPGSFSR